MLFVLQDVQYADIDHMDGFRNFELNASNFGDLPEYFSELRARGMRGVIILVSAESCGPRNEVTPHPSNVGRLLFVGFNWGKGGK